MMLPTGATRETDTDDGHLARRSRMPCAPPPTCPSQKLEWLARFYSNCVTVSNEINQPELALQPLILRNQRLIGLHDVGNIRLGESRVLSKPDKLADHCCVFSLLFQPLWQAHPPSKVDSHKAYR